MQQLLLLVLLAVKSSEGTLCVEGLPCVPAPSSVTLPSAAASPRPYTWTTPEENAIVLGILPRDDARIDPRASTAILQLRMAVRGTKPWPARTTISVRAGESRWLLPLTARQAKNGVELRVMPGTYDLSIESAGYRRVTQRVAGGSAPLPIRFSLESLPQVTGRVIVKATGDPLAGAAISVHERVIAVASGDGRFSFDADPDDWPETVAISAGGYGSVTLAVPRARAATDLLDIALSTGALVRVTIERAPDIRDVTLALFKRRYDMAEQVPEATKVVAEDETGAVFADVSPGDYVVIARGNHPGEVIGKKLSVRAGEEQPVMFSLTPRRLLVRAELASAPLPNAKVRLSHRDGLWHEELRTDAEGQVAISTWQLGRMAALVFEETILPTPHREERTLPDEDAEWTIHVSDREVRGRVIDAATRKPIAHANVFLEVKGRQGYSTVIEADGEGRFVFTAAAPGQHEVSAAADGYRHDTVRYTFPEHEELHDVTIPLTAARGRRVTVRDAAGISISGAAVLDYLGMTLTGERFTDAAGEVVIPIDNDEIRDIYVIPRDGSFATGTIRGKDVTLIVPSAPSTIIVNSRGTDRAVIPGVWVVVRFNGIALPLEVQQMFARQQGAATVSGSDGKIVLRHMPLGIYEFWPVGSAGEVRATMAGLGNDAPINIVARPGLNEATLTFQAKTTNP